MRGEQHLTRTAQYASVYSKGRSWSDSLIVMKALPNNLEHSRCGLSVGRRVGNAVIRNRVKRRLREILRPTPLAPGWDIVFVARARAGEADYHRLRESVSRLLGRAGLLAATP
ncbi:MAG: ribonuclease P protein component [Chloroflexi bacterium]|nr:ribonuclease P protein component [Chloroflexota bacterium]